MGASLLTRRYSGKLTRNQLEKQIASDKRQDELEDGCSYSGSWGVKSGISYENKTFSSVCDAEDWIDYNNDKWGPLSIVKVEEKLGTVAQNKRIETQKEKVRTTQRKLNDFYSQTFSKIKNVKAKTKSCKCCGTRFPISTLGSLNCPNCRKPLLTDTENKKVSTINSNILKEENKLKELISKKGGKTNLYWVVGGVCSC